MSALLKLLQLSDPALPVGSYAHSTGLETYVQQGKVHDANSAKAYVISMLKQNLQYNDGAFASLAFDAATKKDLNRLSTLDEECSAFKVPLQVKQASLKLGSRLLKIYSAAIADIFFSDYILSVSNKKLKGNYCIAFGLLAATLNIAKKDALTGFYYNAAAGYITNCVKLIPLGQQDGQKILFSISNLIDVLVNETITPAANMLGRSCAAFDIRCMQHENLYSRLYMS